MSKNSLLLILAGIIVIGVILYSSDPSLFSSFSIVDSSKSKAYSLKASEVSNLKVGDCYKNNTIIKIQKISSSLYRALYRPGCGACLPIYTVDKPDVTFYFINPGYGQDGIESMAFSVNRNLPKMAPYNKLKYSFYLSNGTNGCKDYYSKDTSIKIKWFSSIPPGGDGSHCYGNFQENTIYCGYTSFEGLMPSLYIHEISHIFGLADLYTNQYAGLYKNLMDDPNLRKFDSWQISDISNYVSLAKMINSNTNYYGLECTSNKNYITQYFNPVANIIYDSTCTSSLCKSTGGNYDPYTNTCYCSMKLIGYYTINTLPVWESGKGCINHTEIKFLGPPKSNF
jgi:hypothetical protein